MPTSKQRREAARRHLERQLQRRQEREQARKRLTLIASAGTAVALVVVLVVVLIAVSGGGKKKTNGAASSNSASAAATSSTPSPSASAPSAPAAKGAAVSFDGVTVKGAADLKGYPVVTSKSGTAPTTLRYKDLVVGTGKAATDSSTVTVQYTGVLYKTGTQFDSSWTRGQPAQFSLQQVVKGFTYGIGGTAGVPPMKVGGRRIMILPASLGYGSQATGPIPANAPLVFVVDLKSVDS